jgi:hypothetical protein
LLGKPLASAASRARLRAGAIAPPPAEEPPIADELAATADDDFALPIAASNPVAPVDSKTAAALDMAISSLVPTMGRVINLPSESAGDPSPHRLFRVGYAPEVIKPTAVSRQPARPAQRPKKRRQVDIAGRYAALRRLGTGANAGPVALIRSAWGTTDSRTQHKPDSSSASPQPLQPHDPFRHAPSSGNHPQPEPVAINLRPGISPVRDRKPPDPE